MNVLALLIPVYLTAAGRFHGGAFYFITKIFPPFIYNFLFARQVRNALFALPFLLVSHDWRFAALAFATAFVGIDLGHYQFWFMGVQQPAPRTGTIEFILRPLIRLSPVVFAYGSLPYSIVGLSSTSS
jgi:hypothetical protein